MTEICATSQKRITKFESFIKKISDSKLLLTDARWSVFLIIWVVLWQYIIHCRKDFITTLTMQLIGLDYNYLAEAYKTNYASVWGQNWVFDTLTGNQAFMNKHMDRNGPVVVCSTLLVSYFWLLGSYPSMLGDNGTFSIQLFFAGSFFLCSSIMYRLANSSSDTFYSIPEYLWLLVCLRSFLLRKESSLNLTTNGIKKMRLFFAAIGYAALIGGPFFLLLKYLITIVGITLNIIGLKLSVENDNGERTLLFTYGIMVIFVSFVLIESSFCVATEAISCMTETLISSKKAKRSNYQFNIDDFFRAMMTVPWPSRIHDKKAMKQKSSTDLQTFSRVFRQAFFLLVGSNGVMHLFYNASVFRPNLKDNPQTSMASFEMYSRIIVLLYAAMKFADAVLDTITLYLTDENRILEDDSDIETLESTFVIVGDEKSESAE